MVPEVTLMEPNDPNNLAQQLAEAMNRPVSVSGPTGSVSMPNPRDLIAMDKYLRSTQAMSSGAPFGMRLGKIVAPGTIL